LFVSGIRRIHAVVKLKTHRASFGGTTQRPSLFDAGHRVQPNSQMAGVRHFRLGTEHVKETSAPARPATQMDRAYLRALRAAEMKSWIASGGDVLRTAAAA